ncbi:MAG: bacterial transcriptional activator domain-containing protein [Chloroflexi bacterium]|nr:bacterial transcriptional activator domain-containing protein [Chloroflexota bacterium]OJV90174.1 MAG: hypothetical protein BGO39_02075 [Chloroflexi bacterium 54-19]
MNETLEILTLGSLILRRGSLLLTEILSNKAAALLVFLACTGRPHTRLQLAEFFWFERSEEQALSNLRTLLTRIRPHLGDNLIVTRETVFFNPAEPFYLDLAAIKNGLTIVHSKSPERDNLPVEQLNRLEDTLSLYRGEFLAGFFVSDANGFEEWANQERELLHSQVVEALKIVSAYRMKLGDYKIAYRWASRLLELDPFNEQALRQELFILAHEGRRTAAMGKYKAYQQYLAQELDIAPEARTTDLYEQITRDSEQLDAPVNPYQVGSQALALSGPSKRSGDAKKG